MMDEKVLSKIKETLSKNMPKDGKAILFGSRARGDNRADSDWDILIVLDKEHLDNNDYLHVSYPLTLLGTDINEEINPIMYTKQQWEANHFTPFFHNVNKEGKVLWA